MFGLTGMLALLNTILVGFVLAYLRNKLLLLTLATVINMGVLYCIAGTFGMCYIYSNSLLLR